MMTLAQSFPSPLTGRHVVTVAQSLLSPLTRGNVKTYGAYRVFPNCHNSDVLGVANAFHVPGGRHTYDVLT